MPHSAPKCLIWLDCFLNNNTALSIFLVPTVDDNENVIEKLFYVSRSLQKKRVLQLVSNIFIQSKKFLDRRTKLGYLNDCAKTLKNYV